MTVIDSSCWIGHYRMPPNPEVSAAVAEVLDAGMAATCGVIKVEVLAYISDAQEFGIAEADFDSLIDPGTRKEDFARAIEIGRHLRSKGLTVPAADLIIAAVAIANDMEVLHSDSHYETIGRHCGLRQRNAMTLKVPRA